MIDMEPFVARALEVVAGAEVAPGRYRRHSGEWGEGGGPDPYGCADAANILYTAGRLPRGAGARAAAVAGLGALQSEDGLWREDTHHPVHTTAHCVAALELHDAGPDRPLGALSALREPAAMEAFLDGLDWRSAPWQASHQGAGLYAALVLAGDVGPDWTRRYMAWLDREADPDTGLWRRGAIGPVAHSGAETLFPHLAGTFHYLFNQQHARAPLPHPAALIDTALALWAEGAFPIGRAVGFAEIDWVYCLNRASRQTPHRWGEVRAALREMAHGYCAHLLAIDPARHRAICDLHALFGAMCALAELQQALPGTIATARPLRLVLDRRPFI